MATNIGTVKWFNNAKGFGFIEQDSGADLFVHFSNINGEGRVSLEDGAKVTYDIGQGEKGPEAKNVTSL